MADDSVNELDALEPVQAEQEEQRIDSDNEGLASEREDDEEEEGEDLIHEDMNQDYRPMPALDRLEADGIDDDVDDLPEEEAMAARRAAEEAMDRRDRSGRRTRLPGALADIDDEELRPARRRRVEDADDEDDDDGLEVRAKIEEVKGKLPDWIASETVNREIRRRFRRFLTRFEDEGANRVYVRRVREMMVSNRSSLEVDYRHLSKADALLAMWVADCPRGMLDAFNTVAREVATDMFAETAAGYEQAYGGGANFEVFVRIACLPLVDEIRCLRNYHLNGLIKVSGVVTRRSGVFPQLRLVKWDCTKCGYILGPFAQSAESSAEVKPSSCPACSSKGPFLVNSAETVYRDYQKLTLQEAPGKVPAGRLPRTKEVILLHDLIDCARPGEEVEVTGVYQYGYDAGLNIKNSFPVFSTHIEANYIAKRQDVSGGGGGGGLTDEDRKEVLDLAKDPAIGSRIIKSIAPSIYGHAFIKTALALLLFGGQEKRTSQAHRIRGDINVLLLGDPGVAKSQFLKYVEKTASRAVYTTGKGASAVGLTAAVHRDPLTREWTLEGGALVLADKGVCLIDEFDKMNDQDRVSIHEAMEQQSISISKAGIVTSLQARCSVLAAANPIGGRYDPSRSFAENVELSDPILSRFDVLCVVRDQVDPVQDAKLAEFVVGTHMGANPPAGLTQEEADALASAQRLAQNDDGVISQELLRKYMAYAKAHCRPQLQQADYERIMSVYAELRKEAARTHGMPIAVRHLESLIRMAESHARMHLREYVSNDDINVAIRMLVTSFIQSQKYSVHKTLERRFKRYLTLASDYHQLTLSLLRQLLREEQRTVAIMREAGAASAAAAAATTTYRIPVRLLEDRARQYEINNLQEFYDSSLFAGSGFRLDADTHIIEYAA